MSQVQSSTVRPVSEMTRQEIITEIGQLEAELSVDESALRQWETKAGKGGSNSGCAAVLLGLILTFIVPPLGIIIVIAGILVIVFNSNPERKKAMEQVNLGQQEIATKRRRLAELKAHSTISDQASTPPPASVDERLAKLADLKAKGLITDAEYDEQRKQILSQI